MEHTTVEDVEAFDRAGASVRSLTEALGLGDVAINHYTLAAGEGFSSGMHTHEDQEEIFYVMAGEAVFETPDGEVEVGAGEAVRFAPGDYQVGKNAGEGTVEALAIGAPKGSTDVRVPFACTECDSEDLRAVPGEDGFTFECPECGESYDAPPV
jgi:uncharacterized cupin superfamily protein